MLNQDKIYIEKKETIRIIVNNNMGGLQKVIGVLQDNFLLKVFEDNENQQIVIFVEDLKEGIK